MQKRFQKLSCDVVCCNTIMHEKNFFQNVRFSKNFSEYTLLKLFLENFCFVFYLQNLF